MAITVTGKNRKRPRPAGQTSQLSRTFSTASGGSEDGDGREHQLWVDKHTPQSAKHLVLHSTKVQAIRDWLLRSVVSAGAATRPSVLAICGKSGSGKSTAVSVLAKEMGIEVTDWSEDMWSGSRLQLFVGDEKPQYQTFAAEFTEFVVRSAYPTLDVGVAQQQTSARRKQEPEEETARRVVIMHDAPQLKDVQLADLLAELRCPLVVVVSDVTDRGDAMYAVERLLSPSNHSSLMDLETLFVPPVTECTWHVCCYMLPRSSR